MLLYLTLSVMTYFDIFRQIYIIRFEVFTVIRYGNCKIRHSDFKRKLITSNVLFLPCLIVKSWNVRRAADGCLMSDITLWKVKLLFTT